MKNTSDKMKIQIEMEVTEPQALALEAMFKRWNSLASMGSSRYISFFVDGDGNFHPNCKFKVIEGEKRELTPELEELASNKEQPNRYDYDNIAWSLHDED